MSKLRKFLTDKGYNESDATAMHIYLTTGDGDALPEELADFSYENKIKSFLEEKEALGVQKNKAFIIADYEKESHPKKWAEMANPILQFVKSKAGLSKEQMEGLDPKGAIQLLIKVKDDAIVSASNNLDSDSLGKITTLQDENQSLLNRLTAQEETLQSEVAKAKAVANQTIYEFQATGAVQSSMRSGDIPFDDMGKIKAYEDLIMPKLLSKYKINAKTKTITMPDGTRAIALDGNGYYSTIPEAITAYAKHYNILKKSNAGENGGQHQAQGRKTIQVQGKSVDMAGLNFLQQGK